MSTRSRSSWDARLLAAGILTAGMALYHFGLPFMFGWGGDLAREPMLRWALFSINAFFSFLLLAGGTITVAIARGPGPRERTHRWVLVGMAGFWAFNATYQVLAPMPLPPRLAGLHWVLLGFAVLVLALYAISLARPRSTPNEGGLSV